MEDKNPIQVAGRLFEAVEYLAEHGPTGLMELSAALGLNKSTAHRIVSSLQYMGYAKQNKENGKYELSYKLVGLADKILRQVDVVKLVHPWLQKLMELSGETVHFVERDGTDAVYIDKVECFQNSIQMVSRIGNRIPLYRSGVGKAMAARMQAEEVEDLWNRSLLVKTTPHTIVDYQEFLKELEQIRRCGYALDNEENEPGVRCIAAALNAWDTQAKYAFSISAPVSRMDDKRIQELAAYVLQMKTQIEQEF